MELICLLLLLGVGFLVSLKQAWDAIILREKVAAGHFDEKENGE